MLEQAEARGASAGAGAAMEPRQALSTGGCEEPVGQGESEEGLPRFARAVAAPQPRTSPFAAALPALASGASGDGMDSSTAAAAGASTEALQTDMWRPEVNVFEDDLGWTMEVALPGVRPGDVRVELADRTLAVSGWRRAAAAQGLPRSLSTLLPAVLGLPPVGEEPMQGSVRARSTSTFSARWTLPAGADTDSLVAVFRGGVLQIRVGRRGALS